MLQLWKFPCSHKKMFENNFHITVTIKYSLCTAGLLGKVEDLMVTSINGTTLLVSFEEPMSLLGVPILFYSIVVITVHTKDIINTTNSTNTSVYLDLDKVHICSQLELMVSGWNEVGEGQISNTSAVLHDGIYCTPYHVFTEF